MSKDNFSNTEPQQFSQDRTPSWDVTVESVTALRDLVLFTDASGNRCFCGQWNDPHNLQHSGACLNAQDVLRRVDSLAIAEAQQ